jgi:hypothetical protein
VSSHGKRVSDAQRSESKLSAQIELATRNLRIAESETMTTRAELESLVALTEAALHLGEITVGYVGKLLARPPVRKRSHVPLSALGTSLA